MTVVLDLPNELADLLHEEAEKRGQPVSDFVRPALEGLVTQQQEVAQPPETENAFTKLQRELGRDPSLEEVMDHICQSIPESEWRKIPPDLAENHDHYI